MEGSMHHQGNISDDKDHDVSGPIVAVPDLFSAECSCTSLAPHQECQCGPSAQENESSASCTKCLIDAAKFSFPLVLSELLRQSQNLIDIAFIGHYGVSENIAAASLAITWLNLWDEMFFGFMTAIDTLLAQSYGADNKTVYAICTGNSLVVVFSATFVVSGLVALCGTVMKLFGVDSDVANEAGQYAFRTIPGLFPLYLNKVLVKFLQTQDYSWPVLWFNIIMIGVKTLLNWLLISMAGMGIGGAAWSTSVSNAVRLLLTCGYLYHKRGLFKETLPIFSMVNFTAQKFKPFWGLAIPGALSAAADGWSFELTTIFAAKLGNDQLSAHAMILSLMNFLYCGFDLQFGMAASIQIGQLIGDQRPSEAKTLAKAYAILSCGSQAILITAVWLCRDKVAELLTSEDGIRHILSAILPIMCITSIGGSMLAVSEGVLTGLAKQEFRCWINLIGYWGLGVPIGIILAFAANLDVYGLWWGFVIGTYSVVSIAVPFMCNINWEDESNKTVTRLQDMNRDKAICSEHDTLNESLL